MTPLSNDNLHRIETSLASFLCRLSRPVLFVTEEIEELNTLFSDKLGVVNFTMGNTSQILAVDFCFPAREDTNETSHVLMARVVISTCNIIFSITAILGNILIFIAFHKESSFHPPSKLLFRCLAATDLCVGVFAQPAFVVYQLSIVTSRLDLCYIAASLSYIVTTILCGVSMATMAAISVDRLFALLLKMRYRQVVTLKRVALAVVIFWFQSIAVSVLVFGDRLVYLGLSCALTLLSVVTPTFCYLKIFFTLCQQRTQVHVQEVSQSDQGQPNGNNFQTGTSYKKTVSSALVFQLVLISCYLPYVVVRVVVAIVGRRLLVSEAIVASMAYLNSSLNPIFYCWKIKEVRYEVTKVVRKAFCLQ